LPFTLRHLQADSCKYTMSAGPFQLAVISWFTWFIRTCSFIGLHCQTVLDCRCL